MSKKQFSTVGMYIDGGPDLASIKEARSSINDILKSGQDQATQQMALSVLRDLCKSEARTINGCNVEMGVAK